MKEEKIREAIKETQDEMYEYVKALKFIGNALEKAAEIEFGSVYVADLVKSMINELVLLVNDRANELPHDFGFWESKEEVQ